MTRNELQEIIQIEMGMNRLAEAKLTDEELAGLDEQVRASHILVGVPQPNPNEEDFTKAKEKILTIKAEIEAGTKTFEAAAAEYSDCPSKAKGGDLGFFPRQGAMVEPFAEAAYALKVGEMSEPVRTQFGYHLIKPTERSKEPAKEALINSKIMDVVRDIEKVVKVERLYEGAPEDEAITPEDEVAPDDTGSDAGDGAPETE
ncbi:MAG: peptidyl-prolyl cis-trans isomerase [Verrucomicrobia bacterium]|nr:peptidyl-prolyl cis-trans isomerase [Verrucomicrobiota bacterium]